jgi:hypothetical protein
VCKGFKSGRYFQFQISSVLIFKKGIFEHLVIILLSIFALSLSLDVCFWVCSQSINGGASIFNSKFQLCRYSRKV